MKMNNHFVQGINKKSSFKLNQNIAEFNPLNMSNCGDEDSNSSKLSLFNCLWNILDDPRAISKASEDSLIKKLMVENPEFLQQRMTKTNYRPSILHKVFRNQEDSKTLDGLRFMKTLMSSSDLHAQDINSRKPEMSQIGEGGLCESYGINIQRMRDIRKIVGQ